MDYHSYANHLISRLKAKGYMLIEPEHPLDFALVKRGALMQTYVVAVCRAFGTTDEPKDILAHTHKWFRSIYGNNGGGLLLFAYYEAPAWAADQIRSFSGDVVGGYIDLSHNKQWAPSLLGWDQDIGAA